VLSLSKHELSPDKRLDGEVPNLYASKNICPNRESSPFVGSPSLLRAKLARRKAVMGIDSTVYIAIDRAKTLREEPTKGHNRWHPDIPPIATVEPGQVIGLETRDALDGQVTPSSTAADLARINLNVAHALTGPIFVKDAEPGDLLEVTLVEIEPQPFGFTCQLPGFGFLRNLFPEPYLVRWTITNGFATSRSAWRAHPRRAVHGCHGACALP